MSDVLVDNVASASEISCSTIVWANIAANKLTRSRD